MAKINEKLIQPTILYSNDSPSENANVQLSDNLSNYKYFKVFGAFKDNFFTENMSGEFLVSTSMNGRIIICGGRAATNAVVQYYGIYNVSDTALTFATLGQITSPTGSNQAKTDGKIKIYQVVGYK